MSLTRVCKVAGPLVAVALVLVALTGCFGLATETVSVGSLTIDIPKGWYASAGETSDDVVHFYSEELDGSDGADVVVVSVGLEFDLGYFTSADALVAVMERTVGTVDESTRVDSLVGDAQVVRFEYVTTASDGTSQSGYCQIFFSGTTATVIMASCPTSTFAEHADDMASILDSAALESSEVPSFGSSSSDSTEADDTTSDASTTVDDDTDATSDADEASDSDESSE